MAVAIQAGPLIATAAPHLVAVQDPDIRSRWNHFQLWDAADKEVARYAVDDAGVFVGGSILHGSDRIAFPDLAAFCAVLMLGRPS